MPETAVDNTMRADRLRRANAALGFEMTPDADLAARQAECFAPCEALRAGEICDDSGEIVWPLLHNAAAECPRKKWRAVASMDGGADLAAARHAECRECDEWIRGADFGACPFVRCCGDDDLPSPVQFRQMLHHPDARCRHPDGDRWKGVRL